MSKKINYLLKRKVRENLQYANRIEKENRSGNNETLAKVCDDYGQFLCDTQAELFRKATEIERFVKDFPEYGKSYLRIARIIRANAKWYTSTYKFWEKCQTAGIFPTLLGGFDIKDITRNFESGGEA
jgi:hypothetical protein